MIPFYWLDDENLKKQNEYSQGRYSLKKELQLDTIEFNNINVGEIRDNGDVVIENVLKDVFNIEDMWFEIKYKDKDKLEQLKILDKELTNLKKTKSYKNIMNIISYLDSN